MNKRQKKKQIPENTDYCYEIIRNDSDGSKSLKVCPHFHKIGTREDILFDAIGMEHPCKTPIYHCSYAKVSSHDDVLLNERIKTCGEKLPVFDW